jgi:hypothetical protein
MESKEILQIMPCHIDTEGHVPDLEKYFINDGKNGNFRGRRLVGVTTDLGSYKGNWKESEFSKVLMWSHDASCDDLSRILKVMETVNELNN